MPLNLDAVRDKVARRTSKGLSFKEGDTIIRILPHTSQYFQVDLSDIAIEFRSHFMQAPGSDVQVFRCLRDKGEQCPFCQLSKQLKDSGDPTAVKSGDDIRASERHLFNVLNLNDLGAGIQSLETGPGLYNDIMKYIANPQWGDMLSPTEGRNWTINLVPKGKSKSGYNDYTPMPHPDKTSVVPHLPADWMQKIDALALNVPEYPDEGTTARWLQLFGAARPTVVGAPAPQPVAVPASSLSPAQVAAMPFPVQTTTTAPVNPVPPGPAASPAVPTAPAPVSPSASPAGATPVLTFAAQYQLLPTRIDEKEKIEVPSCFSTGTGTGYNPALHPCNNGCPVRSQCQLTHLGIPH